jgi:mannose-6-phosphate isomerase-like protein (cupin superfamily)
MVMKEIPIIDLVPGTVKGVEVQLPQGEPGYRETYFEWTASSLTAHFKSSEVSGGILQAWRHVPLYKEIETHIDSETFYFITGTGLMLFIDVKDGVPDIATAQIVRVRAGTQLIISAGKGHFIAVAEDSEPLFMLVVAPKMDAPRLSLPEPVLGV